MRDRDSMSVAAPAEGAVTVGAERLLLVQGSYFLLTGVWPLLHLRSFEAMTGPKPESWLVKMVGLLAGCVGATLIQASRGRRLSKEIRLLAATSATSFAAVDLWYAGVRRRIAPVYLADAAVELVFLGAWLKLGRNAAESETR